MALGLSLPSQEQEDYHIGYRCHLHLSHKVHCARIGTVNRGPDGPRPPLLRKRGAHARCYILDIVIFSNNKRDHVRRLGRTRKLCARIGGYPSPQRNPGSDTNPLSSWASASVPARDLDLLNSPGCSYGPSAFWRDYLLVRTCGEAVACKQRSAGCATVRRSALADLLVYWCGVCHPALHPDAPPEERARQHTPAGAGSPRNSTARWRKEKMKPTSA